MSYYKPPIIVPNIGEDRKRGVGNNGMGQVITEEFLFMWQRVLPRALCLQLPLTEF